MKIKDAYLNIDIADFSISKLSNNEVLILESCDHKLISFYKEGLPVVHDLLLSFQISKNEGVFVPLYLKAEFKNKTIVPIEDPMFFDAFKNAFPSFTKHPTIYKWKVVSLGH